MEPVNLSFGISGWAIDFDYCDVEWFIQHFKDIIDIY